MGATRQRKTPHSTLLVRLSSFRAYGGRDAQTNQKCSADQLAANAMMTSNWAAQGSGLINEGDNPTI